MAKAKDEKQQTTKKLRPTLSTAARESQLIALAFELVAERLLNGTASSQETTHFLKLGSTKEKLEREKLEEENKLLRAKTENLKSQKKVEELYKNAISAMKRYSGHGSDDEEPEDEDDEDEADY